MSVPCACHCTLSIDQGGLCSPAELTFKEVCLFAQCLMVGQPCRSRQRWVLLEPLCETGGAALGEAHHVQRRQLASHGQCKEPSDSARQATGSTCMFVLCAGLGCSACKRSLVLCATDQQWWRLCVCMCGTLLTR